jgi:uncharacterized protein (TIRG00374 family)
MKKISKIVLGITVGGTCLYFALRGFEFRSLQYAISNAHFVWILPWLFLFTLNQWIRTVRWNVLLSPLAKIPSISLFPVLLFGFFMNTILPARSGEFIRAYVVQRKFGIHGVSAFGAIIAERLSDLFGLLLIILFASSILPMATSSFVKLGVFFCVGVGGVVLSLMFINKNKNQNSKNKLVSFGLDLMTKSIAGFVALKSARKISMVVFFSLFIWINEVLMVLLMSKAMLLNLPVLHSAAVLVGLSVGVMIPGAPGYIGTYEFFGKQMLEFLGYASAASLSFVLVLHFCQILSLSVMGVMSFFYLKKVESKIPS